MKKRILLVAAFAMTICAASFTSCSSEDDFLDSSAVVNNQSSENQGNDGLYSCLSNGNGEAVSVKIEGSNATVSRSAVATGEPNAEVVFDKEWKGRLVMKDNSLGVSEIPFTKSTEMLQLDLSNADVMKDKYVVLKKTDMTLLSRGDSNEDDSNAYLDEDAQKLVSALAQGLLKFGVHTAFGDFGDAMADPLLGLIFGGSESNKNDFKAIENQIESINGRLDKICDMYQLDRIKDFQQVQHWPEISHLKYLNEHYIDLLNNNPNQKDALLEEYAKSTTNSSQTLGDVIFLLNKYGGKDQTNRFELIDDYYIRTNPFLEQSYAYREMYRVEDMKVFTQAYLLSMQYLKSQNIANEGDFIYNELKSAYALYVDALQKNMVKNKITDKAFCTIPGAFIVMDKTIKTKIFGNNPHFGHVEYGDNVIKASDGDDFFDRDGAWINSYIYSDYPLERRMTEIRGKCLNRVEASAITGYYGGKRALDKILVDDGGMKRGGTSNSTMLLSNFANANWTQYNTMVHKFAYAEISTSLWDYQTNSYKDPVIQTMKFDAHCVASFSKMGFNAWYCFNGSAPYSADYTQKEQTFSSAEQMLKYIHGVEKGQNYDVNIKNACYEAARIVAEKYNDTSYLAAVSLYESTPGFKEFFSTFYKNYPDIYNEMKAKYNL